MQIRQKELISHYTRESGLVGIIRNQSLWAIDFLALNDRSEFLYGMSILYEESLAKTLSEIPSDLKTKTAGEESLRNHAGNFESKVRAAAEEGDDYSRIYVTSFARGKNDDENERGILTLWDRYTRNEGYCIQFDRKAVKELLEWETQRRSYAWLELTEVRYGVDRQDHEFRELRDQLSLRMLRYLHTEVGDYRFARDPKKMDLDGRFLQKIVSFCGKHKDPAFSDEREIRVIAAPVNVTRPSPFLGFQSPTKIYLENIR